MASWHLIKNIPALLHKWIWNIYLQVGIILSCGRISLYIILKTFSQRAFINIQLNKIFVHQVQKTINGPCCGRKWRMFPYSPPNNTTVTTNNAMSLFSNFVWDLLQSLLFGRCFLANPYYISILPALYLRVT